MVSGLDELADSRGHEADAVLMDLDFLGYADAHDFSPDAAMDC
jgi:hypothetical protein